MPYTPNNPYIPGDPYSYDLKWIVTQIKTAVEEYTTLHGYYDQLINDFSDLNTYVTDYFDNLDLSSEVSSIINEMRADGTLSQLVAASIVEGDLLTPIVSTWLTDHIIPTSPAVDPTLSIPGAAADAYETGLVKATAESADSTASDNRTVISSLLTWDSSSINMADNDHLITGGVQANGSISTAGAYALYKTTPPITISESGTYYMAVYQYSVDTPATVRHIWRIVHADTSTEWHNPDVQYMSTISLLAGDSIQISSVNPMVGFMFVEDPASPVPFVPNGISNVDVTPYGKSIINKAIGQSPVLLTLTKNGDLFNINTGNLTLMEYLTRTGFNNDTFNFGNAQISGYGTVKSSVDDITPLRLYKSGSIGQATVGANHGWFCFTVSAGSLDDSDVGSRWSDGSNTYTLMKVSGGLAYFFYYSDPVNRTAPAANLTSSDAVHQSPVDISTYAATQFFPSICNRSVKLLNSTNTELTANGTYEDYKFTVAEEYNIIHYNDVQDYLNGDIGNRTPGDDAAPALLAVANKYVFEGKNCIVDTAYKFMDSCTLSDCGVLQATFIANANGTPKGYMDNSSGSHFATASPTNLYTPRGTDIVVTPSELIDADQPANSFIQYVESGGDVKYGFIFGYLPDVASGSLDARNGIARQWSNATFNKSYPTAYYNKAVASGDVLEAVGFRLYFEPGDVFSFNYGNATYVFASSSSSVNTSIDMPDLTGYQVELVSSVNAELLSNIVGAAGILYKITGAGAAIFKITK